MPLIRRKTKMTSVDPLSRQEESYRRHGLWDGLTVAGGGVELFVRLRPSSEPLAVTFLVLAGLSALGFWYRAAEAWYYCWRRQED